MLNGEKYNFTTPFYSNITLVAKWKVVDKHLHMYKASVIKPTCSIEGYTIYTCFVETLIAIIFRCIRS